jgi:hypothetical protein
MFLLRNTGVNSELLIQLYNWNKWINFEHTFIGGLLEVFQSRKLPETKKFGMHCFKYLY